ncbi:MAG: hypothetical protein A2096_12980 [Spirochaetes bacterium GWF1_41_5]|nr:MAG: hypothetical protein A2096_12980 [Spirochaetes bacterium GWF1_41_5]HBE02226.1 hypothetical protein [Spirochaetia bacterium]
MKKINFYPYLIPESSEAKKKWGQIVVDKDNIFSFSEENHGLGVYACLAHYEKLSGIPSHFHRFFEITLLLSGRGTNFIGKREYAMSPGSLFFINHLEAHREIFATPVVDKLILGFLPQMTEPGLTIDSPSPLLDSFLVTEPFCLNADAAHKGYQVTGASQQRIIHSWFQFIHTFHQKLNRGKAFFLKNHLLALLSVILEETIIKSPPPARSSPALSSCINYLHTHFSVIQNIDDIIPLSMISRGHFYKIFKKNTGMHPSLYLNNLRVQKARELLTGTTLPVKSIAKETGFVSENYFHRVFKSIAGISPAHYRYQEVTEAKLVQ